MSISLVLDYYLDKKYVTFLLISSIRFAAIQFLYLQWKFHFSVFKLVQPVQQFWCSLSYRNMYLVCGTEIPLI
jgi:hypothetical protein